MLPLQRQRKYRKFPSTLVWVMKKQRLLLHILLFLVTVFTTMLAGAEHILGGDYFLNQLLIGEGFKFSDLMQGALFSLSFLTFLTFHEFGHYFMARYHHVRTTLPYYIPIYFPLTLLNIGSFGAVIRIKEMPGSRRKYFDIGVAGPLAGFVVSLVLLIIGFSTLPDMHSYVGRLHLVFDNLEDAKSYFGFVPTVGTNLLYDGLAAVFANPNKLPPAWEVMHYPLLFAGYLTLFFTALNLLPIGQLDGGHVIYGLFGRKAHGYVSRIAVLGLVFFGGTGLMEVSTYDPELGPLWEFSLWESLKFLLYIGLVYLVMRRINPGWTVIQRFYGAFMVLGLQFMIKSIFPMVEANVIWLVYAFFAVAFIGLDHPGALDNTPLDWRRKVLGYLALLIFVLCFSVAPIQVY